MDTTTRDAYTLRRLKYVVERNWCGDRTGKHRLTTDWANRSYVVYTDKYGAIVRSSYARNTVIGWSGFPVVLGDTFTA